MAEQMSFHGVHGQTSLAGGEACLVQVLACAWLGHWYREVAMDYKKAKNCYEQTLALDPSDTVIGASMKDVVSGTSRLNPKI